MCYRHFRIWLLYLRLILFKEGLLIFKQRKIVFVIVFVISLFTPSKMAPIGTESTWEIYGTFLNLFHPKFKQLIWRLEWVKERIGSQNCVNMFKRENAAYIYIYIYILRETNRQRQRQKTHVV